MLRIWALGTVSYFEIMRSQSKQARRKQGKSSQVGELAVLAGIRARSSPMRSPELKLGIGDDCALIGLRRGEELAVTTDLSIAGVHFRLDWHTPEVIGYRTLARGLSDLAAMGARPVAAFLSLGLPRDLVQSSKRREPPWVVRFLDGLFALAESHRVPLAGGDLAESATPVADIVLTGAVERGKAMLRSGARPGHILYVSGNLGGGLAGLVRLKQLAEAQHARSLPPRIPAKLEPLLSRYLHPEPRVKQGLWLARRSVATAAIDLSDGLSTDLAHLCEESGVAAEVDAAALPIHPGANLEQALHGGDDYELLFTAAPSVRIPRRIAGVPVTRIGRIVPRSKARAEVTLISAGCTEPLAPGGWQHFS